MKNRLSSEGLSKLNHDFKDLLKMNMETRKIHKKKTRWNETVKRIDFAIPEYLAKKFNEI